MSVAVGRPHSSERQTQREWCPPAQGTMNKGPCRREAMPACALGTLVPAAEPLWDGDGTSACWGVVGLFMGASSSPWIGSQDFRYQFSYRAGNAAQRTLYRGTEAQCYFTLPAGEPGDGHQGEWPGNRGAGCTCSQS